MKTPYLFGLEDKNWSYIRELTEAEFRSFKSGQEHLIEFDASRRLLPIVERNESEFKIELDHVRSELASLPKAEASIENEARALDALDELNRRLVNYLTAFQVYLEHSRTRLARRYGRKSSELREFERWKLLAEQQEFSYRFIRTLRNYVQHCGMPITHLVASWQRDTPEDDAEIHSSIEVGFNSVTLLERYNKWGPVKSDLRQIEGYFAAWNPVETATAAIRQIDSNTVKAEYPRLVASYVDVVNTMEDALAKGQTPAIGLVEHIEPLENRRRVQAGFVNVPWNAMQNLGFVKIEHDRIAFVEFN